MSSKKSEKLLSEARKDIEVGNLNKAASALYFSVRKELEDLVKRMGYRLPRRDDKLANILRHTGYLEASIHFMELYELRKKADYGDEYITEDDVQLALKFTEELLKILSNIEKS